MNLVYRLLSFKGIDGLEKFFAFYLQDIDGHTVKCYKLSGKVLCSMMTCLNTRLFL